MKTFHQATILGYTFPSSQKAQCVFFSSSPYHRCSHQYQLVASKDTFMSNKRLTVTFSSLSGMSSEKFPESESRKNMKDAAQELLAQCNIKWIASMDHPSDMDAQFIKSIVCDKALYKYEILDRKATAVKIMKQQGLMSAGDKDEILCALDKIEQDIVQGKFEWRDGQDVHTNIMEALINMVGERAKELTKINQSDRCLFGLKAWFKDCIEQIIPRIKRIQVALISFAIRNEGSILPGTLKTEDNTLLESIILPILKELEHDATDLRYYHSQVTSTHNSGYPVTDAYFERSLIRFIGERINFDVPEHMVQMIQTFASWRNLPSFTPNDEVVTYDTFLEKFRPNQRTSDGLFALEHCLNITWFRSTDHFDIEDVRFYLFSSIENVLEMLDLCIKFAEGILFNQEKVQISPPIGLSDAISFAQFLKSKGLPLKTSYALVCLCLKKQCQPRELTTPELQRIGFPCDQARSLLSGNQMAFNSFTNQDSLTELLFWCGNLEIDPQIFC